MKPQPSCVAEIVMVALTRHRIWTIASRSMYVPDFVVVGKGNQITDLDIQFVLRELT